MLSKLILDYEKTRQLISRLEGKRTLLLSNCNGLSEKDYFNVNAGGVQCHDQAWHWFKSGENRAAEGHYENTYDEVLTNIGCDNCTKARDIKNTSLRKAKSDFGNIKRKLSAAGKRLMKENAL